MIDKLKEAQLKHTLDIDDLFNLNYIEYKIIIILFMLIIFIYLSIIFKKNRKNFKFAITISSIVIFALFFGSIYFINISEKEILKDVSESIFEEGIESIEYSEFKILLIEELSNNKYRVVFENEIGQFIEIEYNNQLILNNNINQNAVYKYKSYPSKSQYKNTYFEDKNLEIGYGKKEEYVEVNEEVIESLKKGIYTNGNLIQFELEDLK